MMNKFHRFVWSFGMMILLGLGAPVTGARAADTVLVIPVKEQINQATMFLFRRALREAEQRGVAAVVIEMDTWGGSVDETKKIMQMLLKTRAKTYTFINDKAISGGSYIAVATQHIYMAPGSTIGASTAVEIMPFGGAQEMPADMRRKLMGTMKAIMRAAAEQNGHRPEIFEAMVDPEMEIELDGKKIVGKGELLVLTHAEAEEEYGTPPKPLLSEGTVTNLDGLLEKAGLGGADIVRVRLTGFEHVARFITFLSPLLIILGLLGVYVEMHTPGFGVFGIGAISCFALVFFGSYLAGLAGWEHFLLLLLGVGLLGVEIFVIPGFGITGISGIVLICVSLLLMMTERLPGGPWFPSWAELQVPLLKLCLSVVSAVVAGYFIGKFLPKTTIWKRMELSPAAVTTSGVLTEVPSSQLTGATGVAETMLRPAGKARFGDQLVDVVTRGDIIERGERVKVIEAKGNHVVVARV